MGLQPLTRRFDLEQLKWKLFMNDLLTLDAPPLGTVPLECVFLGIGLLQQQTDHDLDEDCIVPGIITHHRSSFHGHLLRFFHP